MLRKSGWFFLIANEFWKVDICPKVWACKLQLRRISFSISQDSLKTALPVLRSVDNSDLWFQNQLFALISSKASDVKSARKKWGASPHFCIDNGLIVHPQMFSLLMLSLDTLDMYVCFIFYASSRLLKSNSHRKWQENEDFKGNLVDIFFYFLRSKL